MSTKNTKVKDEDKLDAEEKKHFQQMFRDMVADCPEAIVNFGEGPMVYLAEGIYLKKNGQMYSDSVD